MMLVVMLSLAACVVQEVRRECRSQCEPVRGPKLIGPARWHNCVLDCEARNGAPPPEKSSAIPDDEAHECMDTCSFDGVHLDVRCYESCTAAAAKARR